MQVRQGAWLCALSRARCPREDRGVAAVEFAIILPLLMMILFGIMGFGFAMAQSASLASGAREGARLGSVNGGVLVAAGDHACDDVITKARVQARTIGVKYDDATKKSDIGVSVQRVNAAGTAVTICSAAPYAATPASATTPCTDAAATAATEATIRVTTTLTDRQLFAIPIPGGSLLTPDTLVKSAEYRCEYH